MHRGPTQHPSITAGKKQQKALIATLVAFGQIGFNRDLIPVGGSQELSTADRGVSAPKGRSGWFILDFLCGGWLERRKSEKQKQLQDMITKMCSNSVGELTELLEKFRVFASKNRSILNSRLLFSSSSDGQPNYTTNLNWLLRHGIIRAAEIMLEYGAKPDIDTDGNNAIHCLGHCFRENIETFTFEQFRRLIKLLISGGADVNGKNKEGKTPLGLVVEKYFQSKRPVERQYWRRIATAIFNNRGSPTRGIELLLRTLKEGDMFPVGHH